MAGWHSSKLHELTRSYKISLIFYSITLCILVISLLFRTFCVLLSLIIHVILICEKKSQLSKPQKSAWSTAKMPKRAGQSLTCSRSHDYRVNGSDTPPPLPHPLLHSGFDFSCGCSHDYRLNGSDTPLLHSGFDSSCGVLHHMGLFRWLTLLVILTWTHTNIKIIVLCIVVLCSFGIVIHALEYSGVTLSTAAFSNSVGSWKAAANWQAPSNNALHMKRFPLRDWSMWLGCDIM